MIEVKLYSILKDYCPNRDGLVRVEYKEGLNVKEVLELLNLSNIAGLVLVNGKVAKTDFCLSKGDSIELYPIFGGG